MAQMIRSSLELPGFVIDYTVREQAESIGVGKMAIGQEGKQNEHKWTKMNIQKEDIPESRWRFRDRCL